MDLDKYNKQEHTVSALKGNIMAIVFVLPIVILFGVPFYLLWGNPMKQLQEIIHSGIVRIVINLSIFIAGIVLHEIIHGLTWASFSRQGLKSIKFGILKTSMTPYCHCKEILKVNHYKVGVIMPAIITGFLPSIFSIIIGNPLLLIFGIIFTISATGDFMVLWMLRKEKNNLVCDHPSKIGFISYQEI